MKYLEAESILSDFHSETKRDIVIRTSARIEPLDLFIRAEFASRGVDCSVTALPFGTLQQRLRDRSGHGSQEPLVLFPWDLAPALDWRSGLPERSTTVDSLFEAIVAIEVHLAAQNAPLYYVDAPIPPVAGSSAEQSTITAMLLGAAMRLRAKVFPGRCFSLASYLSFGTPFSASHCGEIAEAVVAAQLPDVQVPKKVLVTDLDNVMWKGVIGEDGPDGIRSAPEAEGYKHFIYQTFLRKLKNDGVLLAAVSRNDPDLAKLPFKRGDLRLREEDMVAILASYNTKSAQIESLAGALNLGLDSFVFVDDNPVELAEVSARLPSVSVVAFPSRTDSFDSFLGELGRLFSNPTKTAEDAQRTEMYRALMLNPVPSSAGKTDLAAFLRGLDMQVVITDRTNGARERAVQLINKTNQFNLNGERLSDASVQAVLDKGGRLFTATLSDAHGEHGEILACLTGPDEEVLSLVMSCRVLERRVEYLFMSWLGSAVLTRDEIRVRHIVTERNTPVQSFVSEAGFVRATDSTLVVDRNAFLREQGAVRDLFKVLLAP